MLLLPSAVGLLAGIAAWPLTGQWQWAVTGVIAAIALSPTLAALYFIVTEEDDAFSGCVWVVLLLVVLAIPGGLTVWLWTGDGTWGWVALGAPFFALFLALTVTVVESEFDR